MSAPINRLESMWPQDEAAGMAVRHESATWINMAKSREADLEHLLKKHPNIAIAAAAALGIVLGWIVKRK